MHTYKESDLVRIAKRENNRKRSYLVVNPLQGKHIPADPQKALAMFRALAETLRVFCEGKRVLVIGFAETATAIGAAVAAQLDAYYLQTTREDISGVRYLFFSEEHSHASQQRLVKDDMDAAMSQTDCVIFAEDEVTTGNTILNIINILEKEYPGRAVYAAASVLNGMDREALDIYESRNIGLFYLVKTDHRAYPKILQQYSVRGEYISCMPQDRKILPEGKELETAERTIAESAVTKSASTESVITKSASAESVITESASTESVITESAAAGTGCRNGIKENHAAAAEFEISGWMDARRLVSGREYEKACRRLWQGMDRRLKGKLTGRVLVLGTEEFMYPALLAADCMAQTGAGTWFHATTRSPIEVFEEEQYPLHVRYEFVSLYDRNRKTFVYDIASYDAAVIMTDAHNEEQEGLQGLVRAVASAGNEKIYVIRWC